MVKNVSSIREQLHHITKKHRSLHDNLERKNISSFGPEALVPSILYPSLEAADQDLEFVYEEAISSIEELAKINPWWENYLNNQMLQTICFGRGPNIDRSLLTLEECKQLDREILVLLKSLCPYYHQTTSTHKILEFLIRKLRIHHFNTDPLIVSLIPMHETLLFFRVLQTLYDPLQTRWSFLFTAQKNMISSIPRSFIVNRCISDPSLILLIFSFIESIQKSHSLSTSHSYQYYMSFYTCLFCQVIDQSTAQFIQQHGMTWLMMTIQTLSIINPDWHLVQWTIIKRLASKMNWFNTTNKNESIPSIITHSLCLACIPSHRPLLIKFLASMYNDNRSHINNMKDFISDSTLSIISKWSQPDLSQSITAITSNDELINIKSFLDWICKTDTSKLVEYVNQSDELLILESESIWKDSKISNIIPCILEQLQNSEFKQTIHMILFLELLFHHNITDDRLSKFIPLDKYEYLIHCFENNLSLLLKCITNTNHVRSYKLTCKVISLMMNKCNTFIDLIWKFISNNLDLESIEAVTMIKGIQSTYKDSCIEHQRHFFIHKLVTLPCTKPKAILLDNFVITHNNPSTFLKYFWFDNYDMYSEYLDQLLILQYKIFQTRPSDEYSPEFEYTLTKSTNQLIKGLHEPIKEKNLDVYIKNAWKEYSVTKHNHLIGYISFLCQHTNYLDRSIALDILDTVYLSQDCCNQSKELIQCIIARTVEYWTNPNNKEYDLMICIFGTPSMMEPINEYLSHINDSVDHLKISEILLETFVKHPNDIVKRYLGQHITIQTIYNWLITRIHNHAANILMFSSLMELVHSMLNKINTMESLLLIPILFDWLSILSQYQEEQYSIGLILYILGNLQINTDTDIKSILIDQNTILEYERAFELVSSSITLHTKDIVSIVKLPQWTLSTKKKAIECLVSISRIEPLVVFQTIMPLFLFMNASNNRIETEPIFGLCIELLKSLIDTNSETHHIIVSLFMDALPHIPTHRKSLLFSILIQHISKEHAINLLGSLSKTHKQLCYDLMSLNHNESGSLVFTLIDMISSSNDYIDLIDLLLYGLSNVKETHGISANFANLINSLSSLPPSHTQIACQIFQQLVLKNLLNVSDVMNYICNGYDTNENKKSILSAITRSITIKLKQSKYTIDLPLCKIASIDECCLEFVTVLITYAYGDNDQILLESWIPIVLSMNNSNESAINFIISCIEKLGSKCLPLLKKVIDWTVLVLRNNIQSDTIVRLITCEVLHLMHVLVPMYHELIQWILGNESLILEPLIKSLVERSETRLLLPIICEEILKCEKSNKNGFLVLFKLFQKKDAMQMTLKHSNSLCQIFKKERNINDDNINAFCLFVNHCMDQRLFIVDILTSYSSNNLVITVEKLLKRLKNFFVPYFIDMFPKYSNAIHECINDQGIKESSFCTLMTLINTKDLAPNILDQVTILCINVLMNNGMNIGKLMEAVTKSLLNSDDEIQKIHGMLLNSKACRHSDGHIRICFIESLNGFYAGLRKEPNIILNILPEAIPFIGELMEDEIVESHCRSLISTLEEILGDDLKSFLHE